MAYAGGKPTELPYRNRKASQPQVPAPLPVVSAASPEREYQTRLAPGPAAQVPGCSVVEKSAAPDWALRAAENSVAENSAVVNWAAQETGTENWALATKVPANWGPVSLVLGSSAPAMWSRPAAMRLELS